MFYVFSALMSFLRCLSFVELANSVTPVILLYDSVTHGTIYLET